MAYRLGEAARAAGHRLHVHDRLGSTNTEALERARAGETGPLWVVTHRQEAGRGRRGNTWASLPGNLAASVLWPVPRVAPENLAQLGFVAGVALAGAVEAACGTLPGWDRSDPARSVRLKWPNDLLLGGAKMAGLLLEAEVLPGGRRAVVIGFGVNVAAAPEGLPAKGPAATSLAAAGYVGGPEALLDHLSDHLAAQARTWDGGRNFTRIRALWLARAAGLGSEIAVASGGQVLRGRFDTIDEGGRLVILGPENARHVVTAGEVHFGTAATAA
ncbi:biotin--[acetyl-CoA-carboxylase] ligase [Methylobacterium persicinum]|uniref:biotin--[biotin carboxyl-carrier protein] ligase n=1 Tax=Methylobacterium persicinum TaxID=374426 RepID=A0ABU0HLN6_9HYPH|nr:biotin--[acetyl-CoA-carboxylase] ligase [Methylobacterium persicinum]MDQ0443241.1 BirA family biotin operon repressor/biotin-[acetyl-CoA-carboxylase] ligase [Methylobacterium persicinum]GJE38183.1 Bifunctional ligase/repressor BirA [Methylobacterium persicinum]